MKITILLLTLTIAITTFSQEKSHDVRRTIGLNFTPMNASNDYQNYRSKFGLIYRQCFGSYVLQAELNKQWQGHDFVRSNNTPNFINSDTAYTYSRDLSITNMSLAQLGLLKGWTNDITNLYIGVAINGGISKESGRYSEIYYSSSTDSVSGIHYTYPLNELRFHQEYNPKYFKIGLVGIASIELKVMKNLSAIIQFSPEFSWFWKMKSTDEDTHYNFGYFNDHYKQMTHNGIEISLNYKL